MFVYTVIKKDERGVGWTYKEILKTHPELAYSSIDSDTNETVLTVSPPSQTIMIKAIQELYNLGIVQKQRIDDLETENIQLRSRVELIESMLNITTESIVYLPEELGLYECPATLERRECPGGLSKVNQYGNQTRCYNTLHLRWKTCNSGWNSI